MFLLHFLNENRKKLGIELCVAHFEHGIRGEESIRDASFVKALCGKLDIPLCMESNNTPEYAKAHGIGMEEAARELRYEFLQRAAAEMYCDVIATAHNADDNAETVIFNLTRGSGAKGLRGIPRQRGNIIRPILDVSRTEIEAWLQDRSIEYIIDSTNLSDDYSRNLIRHQVIPVLKKINPGFCEAVGRAAGLLAQDEDCLELIAHEFISENLRDESLKCEALLAQHPAVASRVLRALCPQGLSEGHVKALMELAAGEGLGHCDVPGLQITREQGRLWFRASGKLSIDPEEIVLGTPLFLPEAGLKIFAEEKIYNGEVHDLFKTYFIKCESICGKLILSSRMPGDKIRPQGRNCTKSLKSIFVEKKMTQRQRGICPVIRDDKGVLILMGHAVDERCRPEKGDRVICIETEQLE